MLTAQRRDAAATLIPISRPLDCRSSSRNKTMKISLEWLNDFLPSPPPAETAADALTNGGLPVELIERHGSDSVIDVEVTSNRGDCLCHLGVARAGGAARSAAFGSRRQALGIGAEGDSPPADGCAHRRAGPLPALHGADHPRCEDRPVARLGGAPARGVRAAGDQQCRRRDQLRHVRDGSAAARIRLREARGRRIVVRQARRREDHEHRRP